MKASEFMTSPVVTVSPDTSVKEAANRLVEHGITAAPVDDDGGAMVGIVSEVDLLRGRVEPDPRAHERPTEPESGPVPTRVAHVMTVDVLALPETADESEFARLMTENKVKSIPVLDGERVVGIVSRRDLLRTISRSDSEIREEIVARLRAYTGGSDRWGVSVEDGTATLIGAASSGDRRVATLLARTVPGVSRIRTIDEDRPTATLDHGGLRVLSLEECLQRLNAAQIGRIAFDTAGEPMILPVNYAMDGTSVVFRSAAGTKLAAAERGGAVAFEIDAFDERRRDGWSVVVRGEARVEYDDAAIAHLDSLGVHPWADAVVRPVWVVIRSEEITGREIVHASAAERA